MNARGRGAFVVVAASTLILASCVGTSQHTSAGGAAGRNPACARGGLPAGRAWTRITAARGYQLVDLAFRSACDGILVGAKLGPNGGLGRGVAVTTADAGRHLVPARLPVVGALNAVAVAGRQAWAVGNLRGRPEIVESGDGGRTWQTQALPPGGGQLNGVFFADAGHGWAVGEGTIFRTDDGGKRWLRVHAPAGVELRDVGFAGRRRGWAVGKTSRAAVVFATLNRGLTWRRALTVPDGIFSGVDVVDGSHVYAAGAARPASGGKALLVATASGGRSWRRVAVPRATDVGGQYFATPARGWISVASGVGGEIRVTRDGGRRWAVQAGPPLFAAGPFAFVGRSNGWMVGPFGLFATTDGGGRG